MSNAVSVDEITVIHTVEIFIHKVVFQNNSDKVRKDCYRW